MYVRAISVGHAVPRMQFDAVVHSVFASAVNLKVNDQEPLLTLLTSTEGDLPQGIRLEPSRTLSFERLHAGTPAACRHGVLHVDEKLLTIDLQQAACWDSSLPSMQARMEKPAVHATWKSVWRTLDNRQAARSAEMRASCLLDTSAEAQPPWVQQAGRCMRDLIRATARYDAAAIAVIKQLVGLGPGLTPSGDDLLAGYLLGLHYAVQGKQERIGLLVELARAIMDGLHRTGDISRTYLFHAARGEPSRALFRLAHAICAAAGEPAVLRSAEAAMAAGHTSGMDTVTGLLMGLAAWDARELLGMDSA